MLNYEWILQETDKESQCVYTELMLASQNLISKMTQWLFMEQYLCFAHHIETVLAPAHTSLL